MHDLEHKEELKKRFLNNGKNKEFNTSLNTCPLLAIFSVKKHQPKHTFKCQISKRYKEGASKHNTLLRCNVSQGRRHVSAFTIRPSSGLRSKEEILKL